MKINLHHFIHFFRMLIIKPKIMSFKIMLKNHSAARNKSETNPGSLLTVQLNGMQKVNKQSKFNLSFKTLMERREK